MLVLYVILAYIAIFVFIVGTLYRLRAMRHAAATFAPQLREARLLLWESIPWHLGIIIILLAHLIELIARYPWQLLVDRPFALWLFEGLGLALSVTSFVGLSALLIQRFASPRLRAMIGPIDIILLGVLLWVVGTGIGTAIAYRWGTAWSTSTTVPYVISLLALHPRPDYVSALPWTAQAHIVGGWIFLLLLPFSRFLYLFLLPLPLAPAGAAPPLEPTDLARRNTLRGIAGIVGGSVLLGGAGLAGLLRYLAGPNLTREQSVTLDQERLLSLEQATQERDLILQREREDYILVAAVSELTLTVGKYFTDYQLRPALAFLGRDGFPMFISAKCTHLGCTVGNTVNAKEQILCPCHISYFNIYSGIPTPQSPAKLPLPHLGWVLRDPQGTEIASQTPDGRRVGQPTPAQVSSAQVYITRRFSGGA